MLEYNLADSLQGLVKWALMTPVENRDTALDVWKKKFKTNDVNLVLRSLLLLNSSCYQLISFIEESEYVRNKTKPSYLGAVNSLVSLIALNNLSQNWNSLKNSYATAASEARFSSIGESLHSKVPSGIIENEEIEALIINIEDVKKELLEITDNILLKNYLIKEFEFLTFSLKHFEFLGCAGIEESTGKILQKCFTSRESIPNKILQNTMGISIKTLKILALIGAANAGVEAICDGTGFVSGMIENINEAEIPETKLLPETKQIPYKPKKIA